MSIDSVNPATGETVARYEETTPGEVTSILESAERACAAWRRTSFEQRAALMRRAGTVLRQREDEYAALMATEMGKPLPQGRAEVEKCAWVCEYYAEEAERFLAPEEVTTDASRSFVTFQPLGVVLAVMPWNFPLWQVFRFAVPALMAGNAAVLKHSSNVMGCALAIESVFHDAGIPRDLFRTLVVGSSRVSSLIAAPQVKAVTLTGSTPAGKAVAAAAGAVLKKTVLELGGSDPYVILEDADLEGAAETCVNSRLINSGQSCIAAKRFVVLESVRRRFEELYVQKMRAKRMGDPFEEGVDVGPQARRDLRDELHRQVTESVSRGAKVLLGAEVPAGSGAFYPPTVLTDVVPGMPAYEEELFGPVAAIIGVRDEADAIRVANDTSFGLGAAVFTQDVARGERIAAGELEAGSCFVNAFVKSDPRLPFGGIKESGYGRELSIFGIREFVNIKTVYVK
ncbi:MAG: aldehyde dehydrogenase family protein [Gemmatimonadales bacterium]|nr:aldehyde dehydrogenase family protein [Gemmatimonadales bacterium]NIN11065.1 aldehyde dehydrogenase family protein [Gemmatimonadales bacterium]NIN49662.1 aldehyde dehydrogenase family protein [Gemmatimonadales bacterium]NIP07126.1 aldehyde dehydrogenase family protein [Gemmatimonadales bacterium]NIQ99517.1 aldehyde dehydrogenase family protein [Gemmatimonadales bacterium]